jgi:hypothetical protein
MTNVINLNEARAAKICRDLERATREYEAELDAQQRAAFSVGFKFIPTGQDRWGDPTYSVSYNGRMLIDGRAEFSRYDALALVRELMEHCASPDRYLEHAEGFAAVLADLKADADAAIEADRE